MNEPELEKVLAYQFQDRALLARALTHSSYCRENGLPSFRSNERLEFLGDAYLDAIVGAELFRRRDHFPEGKLTKDRALIVCESALADEAQKLRIGSFLNLGQGEERTGGRKRTSMLADALEAVIGAVYLDGGYEAAERFVLRIMHERIEEVLSGNVVSDYKSRLQEILQEDGTGPAIRYLVDGESGPDHDKTFFVHLEVNGKACGKGSGKSKKEAEQNAAKATIEEGYSLQDVL